MTERAQLLKQALVDRRAADDRVGKILRDQFPVGGEICWQRETDGPVLQGIVTQHFYGDRIEVRNRDTGKAYAIHAYWIVG